MTAIGNWLYSYSCIILFITMCNLIDVDSLTGSYYEMENFVLQEIRLYNAVKAYLNRTTVHADILKRKFENVEETWSRWPHAPQEYIGDPINAFRLLRRLSGEWPIILGLISEHPGFKNYSSYLPQKRFMRKAFNGITRLQEVYDLPTKWWTKERTTEQKKEGYSDLTARDCYDIGRYLYRNSKHLLARTWFLEAVTKIDKGDDTVHRDLVMSYIQVSTYFSECSKKYQQETNNDVILQDIIHRFTIQDVSEELEEDFIQVLNNNCSKSGGIKDGFRGDPVLQHKANRACQGRTYTSPKLQCFYIDYENPRLIIAPFKMEEIHIDPPVLMFHDVVSNTETEALMYEFLKVKKKCGVYAPGWDEDYQERTRTCDSGWLPSSSPVSAAVRRRAGDMTGLSMEKSEANQIANYGIAGEYAYHYDSFNTDEFKLGSGDPAGDRLATLMFYLNDVALGGLTAFPEIKTAVTPKKGSAVFWYNMDGHGETLYEMLHAGCPVFRGTKTIMNIWIHEGDQDYEFTCPSSGKFPPPRYYLKRNKH